MNTHNTKFTFNKKSFALSLACVGMLATSANAYTIQLGTSFQASNTTSVSNQSSSIVISGNSATTSTSNHITNSKLEVDMSKANKTLTVEAGASKDGLKDLIFSGGTISGAVTISDTLSSLTFKGDTTLKAGITVGANIGTIGSTQNITISGSTTGFTISDGKKVDKFLAKDVTVKENGTGIKNSGTIDAIIINGSLTVEAGSTTGEFLENSGKIGKIEIIGGSSEIKIKSTNSSTEGAGIDNTDKGTIDSINIDVKTITIGSSQGTGDSGSSVLITNEGGTISNGINIKTSGGISVFASGAATDTSYLIEQEKGTIKGGITIAAGNGIEIGKKADKNGNTKLVYISGGTVEGKIDISSTGTIKIAGSGANSGILLDNAGLIKDGITIQSKEIELDGSGAKSVSVINNTGTILGTVTLNSDIKLKASSSGSAVLNTGVINKLVNKGTITAAQISGGTIYAFVNEGMISGASVFNSGSAISIKDFENKGMIVLDDELKLAAVTKDIEGSTVTANTFTNEGTIINDKMANKSLISFTATNETKTFDIINKGYLENSGGAVSNAVFTTSGDNTLNVENSGTIVAKSGSGFYLSGDGTINVKNSGTITAESGSAFYLSGSGTLNVYNYGNITAKGTNGKTFSGGTVNIKHWDIKATTNDFSNQGFTYSGSTVNIDEKALVIEPQKGFKFGEYVKIENMVKEGNTDKAIGLDKFSTTDDIFVISGAKGTDSKDGLMINVDSSRSAAAAATQSSVNASVTRSAFVGNVVGSAVNTAITNFGGINRVSYNDDDVDFSKLEKYARVGSDITDQTYANNSHVFVMPYYTKTSVEVARGGDLNGNTYGLIGGLQKKIGDSSVLGFFIGSEKAKSDATNLDIDDTTWYSGINLYKTLGGTSELDYFAKGMLRTAFTSSDITNAGAKAKSNTNSYGLEAAVGINIYAANHTLTPELGLSYDKVSIDGFMMRGNTYEDNNLNLFVGKLGLNWLAQWTNQVSTNLGTGVRLNFKDDFEQGVIVNDQLFKSKTDLEKAYYYVNLGLTYSITNAWDLSFIYNGDFSSNTSANSGFVKLGYWW